MDPSDTNRPPNAQGNGSPGELDDHTGRSTLDQRSHRTARGVRHGASPIARLVRLFGRVGAMLVGLLAAFVVAVTTMLTGSAEVRRRARREAANLGAFLVVLTIMTGAAWLVIGRLAHWLLAL